MDFFFSLKFLFYCHVSRWMGQLMSAFEAFIRLVGSLHLKIQASKLPNFAADCRCWFEIKSNLNTDIIAHCASVRLFDHQASSNSSSSLYFSWGVLIESSGLGSSCIKKGAAASENRNTALQHESG